MEWLLWIAIGILAYIAISRFTAPTKGIKTMSTDELKPVLGKKDKQYIDVRTPVEFKANHIKGFKNIPLNELPKRVNELSKDKETLVICQSGMRSSRYFARLSTAVTRWPTRSRCSRTGRPPARRSASSRTRRWSASSHGSTR